MRPQDKMASQNYHEEVFGEKSAEQNFQTVFQDPIEEDTYYYSENSRCVAKRLSEFRQTRSDTLGVCN